jgi:hypothetical protein
MLRPAVLPDPPFAFAVELEAGRVNDQMLDLLVVVGAETELERAGAT